MRRFVDNQGRDWRIDINVGTLLDIKTELGVDLLSDPQSMPLDIEKQVDMLWLLVSEQAEHRRVTSRDFAKSLGGEAIAKAVDALMHEVADFFCHLRKSDGVLIREAWSGLQQMQQMTAEQVEMSLGKLSTGLQELLVSIHGHSKGGN